MFTARVTWPDQSRSIDVVTITDTVTFTTNAIGGFGSCTYAIKGRRLLPYLSTVRLYYGTQLVWEGRIEDRGFRWSDGTVQTYYSCLGFKRLLDDTGIRRIWSRRDLQWDGNLVAAYGNSDEATLALNSRDIAVMVGQYDPTDLSKIGVKCLYIGAGDPHTGDWNGAQVTLPSGITATRVRGKIDGNAGNFGHWKYIVQGGTGWGYVEDYVTNADNVFNINIAGSTSVRVGITSKDGQNISAGDYYAFHDLRILATSITSEDDGGGPGVGSGFYGGTILNDLVTLVPGLAAGLIESGSDFVIQSVDYGSRTPAAQIVADIAALYAREWAVWDGPSFQWAAPNLDEAQWIVPLAETVKGDILGTIDNLTKTVYVLYADAASGIDSEQSTSSTDQRNPLVKAGIQRDQIMSAGQSMTGNTASQLSSRAIAETGAYPPVSGTVVLEAEHLVQNAVGQRQPAFTIRAGTNITIPDLPKSDYFSQGRDGETLFHISSTEADMATGRVTLTLEGQHSALDVLTARLATATRTVTG